MTIQTGTLADSVAPAAGEPAALLCPGCGYDLRAATSDRCSECGLAIDRAALRESGFPWAHRRRLGRPAAFLRTVWQVTVDSNRLRHELARPQAAGDARRFRWSNAAAIAVALLAPYVFALVAAGADGFALPRSDPTAFPPPAGVHGSLQDLAVPWFATLGWALVPCLAGLAYYLAGASRAVFRLRGFPPEHQARADAVGTYAAAPLALLPVALGFGLLSLAAGGNDAARAGFPFRTALLLALVLAACVTAVIAPCAALYRTGQWLARARHAGGGTVAIGAAELLARWLLGLLFFVGFLPWCAGFVLIVVDSFL